MSEIDQNQELQSKVDEQPQVSHADRFAAILKIQKNYRGHLAR